MRGDFPPLHNTSSWHDVQLKNTGTTFFTFTFIYDITYNVVCYNIILYIMIATICGMV